jgi:hypothetical protein
MESDGVELEVYAKADRGWVVRVPGQQSPVLLLGGAAVYSFFALAIRSHGALQPAGARTPSCWRRPRSRGKSWIG